MTTTKLFDRIVPQIEESLDLSLPYQSLEERYYTQYFHLTEDNQDQVVLVHSNRICLVSLSPNHTVIKDQKKIKSLNFDVSKRSD